MNRLNVIHVAGTKGKGSTCAFVDSFLKAHKVRTGFPCKIGLYTSPHLISIQERIRIDSQPLAKSTFAKYVFEVWDKLALRDPVSEGPRYLQFLFLVSVHAFIKEEVDVAIYETHNGGQFDATNIFSKPVVTGITTIGMDHVEQLGPTIEDIAWHKSGIFKDSTPAFTVPQEAAVDTVLTRRADEKGIQLQYANRSAPFLDEVKALKVDVQRTNASLAVSLVDTFLQKKAPQDHRRVTRGDIAQGVNQFFWLGRFQQICEGKNHWFIDGAHNEISVQKAAQWFADAALEIANGSDTNPIRIVIFSHISERDGAALLRCVAHTLKDIDLQIDHLILSTYNERKDGINRPGKFATINFLL